LPPIISAHGLSKRYGSAPLFQDISFNVAEGDRVGIIGPNGSGKSTLLEILNGRVRPDSGDAAIRKGTRLSLVMQISEFDPGETIRSVIDNALDRAKVAESERLARVAEILGRAGFTDLDTDAATLSGGWRKRLAIAEGLVQHPDILLLDEPTNHLDLRAKDVLLEAIARFNGTVVMVSHDRYFIDRLATRIFEVEGGHVHVYPGNYEDYLHRKQMAETQGSVSNGAAPVDAPQEVVKVDAAAKVRRLNPIKLRQLQERCSFVEEEIPRLEGSIARAEESLGVYESAEETQRVTQLLENLREQHASLTAEWEELVTQLEQQA